MNVLDYDIIRNFYNNHANCWSADLFSQMTTAFIDKYVQKTIAGLNSNATILNAGSGGKCYKTVATQFHLDIAEKTLSGVDNAFVGNIVDMPFIDSYFDCVICVGTVINYCEADKAIKEISRVSKRKALLILEYERSSSGLVIDELRNKDCILFHHTYFNEPHTNFLYSDFYVKSLLLSHGFKMRKIKKFNTTIPWVERFTAEETAHRLVTLEPLFRSIPFINKYSHNAIVVCQKQ